MDKLQLTPQQLSFMETFGYLHFPGLMRDCADQIIAAFEAVCDDEDGGETGGQECRQER